VVFDECQNGIVDDIDAVFDPRCSSNDCHLGGFEVVTPIDIPPLPSDGLTDLKQNAAREALHALAASASLDALLRITDALRFAQDADDISDQLLEFSLTYACSRVALTPGRPVPSYCPPARGDGPVTLHTAAVDVLLDMSSHYAGIAADPPDPRYGEPTALHALASFSTSTDNPVQGAFMPLANSWAVEEALSAGLLTALERYQGAALAADGGAALGQARAIGRYATLLADEVAKRDAIAQRFLTTLDPTGDNLAAFANELTASQARIATIGWSPEEIRIFSSLGIGAADVEDARVRFVVANFGAFDASALSAAGSSDLARALRSLAIAMDTIVEALAAHQGRAVPPVCEPGGPYTGNEGSSLQFDGSRSMDRHGTGLTFAWDLDGDGEFDDSARMSPVQEGVRASQSLVGLSVTDGAGRCDVAYTSLVVSDINRAPTFQSIEPPDDGVVQVAIGTSRTFRAQAVDGDGDPVTQMWFADGVPASTTASFEFHATVENVGIHVVSVEASDGNPFGGLTRREWRVWSVYPDADADGWRANADCDDGDATVNPGRVEVPGNSKDDDCTPVTTDLVDADGDGAYVPADCNDADWSVNPAQSEILYNGKDDDCDLATLDAPDADSDGYVRPADCDELDPNVHPGQTEVHGNGTDDDCDAKTPDRDAAHADTQFNSRGTDFWLMFPGNYQGQADLSLFVTGDVEAKGTVQIPGLDFSARFSITPGSVTTSSCQPGRRSFIRMLSKKWAFMCSLRPTSRSTASAGNSSRPTPISGFPRGRSAPDTSP
jgi:hypothetical protein